MFDLVDRPRLWISVKWPGLAPGPDDGLAVEVEHEIEVEVDLVDREEIIALFPAEKTLSPDEEIATFKRLVSGWRKFKIAGQTAEFSDANIRKLLSVPMFSTGFELAYMKAWQGKGEAREKNSPRSPGNGRAAALSEATGTASSSAIAAASE